ncbi:MAG: hypothetical protein HY042_11030, partial [Spirochaetia bacterium]|nr:hypothetical protein [Spirochaetia bacterium]
MTAILKKFPALWITVGILALIEVGVRLAPAEYGMGAGIFLSNYYRKLADADGPVFDYVVLGDSKSMSLKGHKPTTDEPYSVYNFSMPALGPRYFPFFLEKYLRHRSKPPAAVIFAADPWLLNRDFYRPAHDPEQAYSDDDKQSLPEYLVNRVTRRVGKFFWSKG